MDLRQLRYFVRIVDLGSLSKAAADLYVDKLRRRIGSRFPTALTSFPYVDYHPALPYSVFLGPGGVPVIFDHEGVEQFVADLAGQPPP